MDNIGIDYKFGGDSKYEGFDCSGLVIYSVKHSLGLKIPRTVQEQFQYGKKISKSKLKSGDLFFFNTTGKRVSHVGIYLYNGLFIHAPQTGSQVKIDNMDKPYWQERYKGARRVIPLS